MRPNSKDNRRAPSEREKFYTSLRCFMYEAAALVLCFLRIVGGGVFGVKPQYCVHKCFHINQPTFFYLWMKPAQFIQGNAAALPGKEKVAEGIVNALHPIICQLLRLFLFRD